MAEKRRNEEDVKKRREEEVKRSREVMPRFCKLSKVTSSTTSEEEESNGGRACAPISRKFLNLFAKNDSQNSATGVFFQTFITNVVELTDLWPGKLEIIGTFKLLICVNVYYGVNGFTGSAPDTPPPRTHTLFFTHTPIHAIAKRFAVFPRIVRRRFQETSSYFRGRSLTHQQDWSSKSNPRAPQNNLVQATGLSVPNIYQ